MTAAWAVCMVRVLQHRIFVGTDSLISYAHVWYISQRLWHHHWLPMAMPVLDHGAAFAYPYGFLPWTTAAILRPALGDWAVTLMLVVGTAALIVSTFLAFPELRRNWWAAAVLANPALIAGMLLGQLPFVWGAAMLLGAVACWRRGHRNWATLLLALAQTTHVAVIGPIALGLVALQLRREPQRRAPIARYLASLLPAIPAAVIVLRSPVYTDSPVLVRAWGFINTVGPRSLVVVVPLVLLAIAGRHETWAGAASLLAVGALAAAMWGPIGMPWAWRGMDRVPDPAVGAFAASPAFRPGATYRLLTGGDGNVGLYELIQAGGRSDREFFRESALRRSWPSDAAYSAMLRARHVDVVVLWRIYALNHTNEQAVLDHLAAHPPQRCDGRLVCVRLVEATALHRLYSVTSSAAT
ncbi:MAG: Undecaprenyl-phosphate mannosyltransferase [Acidimicrobiales bacterium]|nr:Undecaprenyl-phosphate mannosyltransferase [Acidimicrobiales bacterium]